MTLTPKTYDFKQKLKEGEAGEAVLDRFFRQLYPDWTIIPALMTDQRRGIDRWFSHRDIGIPVGVEYKTDSVAAKTGNAFIETKTYPDREKSGWAYTSQAEWLYYCLPDVFTVYAVQFAYLRQRHLPTWESAYPTGKARNKGYDTFGLLVPLAAFARCASKTFDLRKELS